MNQESEEVSEAPSRKRKRNPSHDALLAETKMTLRKRPKRSYADMVKPQVPSNSIIGRQPDQLGELSALNAHTGKQGASFVRYEVIEKKG